MEEGTTKVTNTTSKLQYFWYNVIQCSYLLESKYKDIWISFKMEEGTTKVTNTTSKLQFFGIME
jgi:hypothetical protein